MYNNPLYRKLPLVQEYTNGYQGIEGMYIAHPWDIHRCFVLDRQFENFLGFQNVKTKA